MMDAFCVTHTPLHMIRRSVVRDLIMLQCVAMCDSSRLSSLLQLEEYSF